MKISDRASARKTRKLIAYHTFIYNSPVIFEDLGEKIYFEVEL